MSFFIDKHGRRKSPIALAACGAALLDLAVYFCTAALLAGPLYRTVSFGGGTVTSMLHTIIITVISTLLCCLLFLLKDKRVVPYGFAGLAVILLMFCAAAWMLPQETRGSMLRLFLTVGLPPVLLGNAVSWPIYRRLRKAHPEYFVRKTISEERWSRSRKRSPLQSRYPIRSRRRSRISPPQRPCLARKAPERLPVRSITPRMRPCCFTKTMTMNHNNDR
jgi:hypothetical protein